jgi:phospholipid-binding lipoprotein MlaA
MSYMTSNTEKKMRHIALLLAMTAGLAGCATGSNPQDPYEGFNRGVYKFNDGLDRAVLKPVAKGYVAVTPSFVQTGVSNFFGNLSDVWTAANQFLQGKGEAGFSDVTRVLVNSTFGLLGVIDVASKSGLQKHNEDFGQTLGWWGVQPGPYVMLPLFGPSTARDTVALPVDLYGDPWHYKDPTNVRNIGTALRLVDKRASLLDSSNLLAGAALDPYEFLRDGYLQQRRSKVYDGDPPPEPKGKDDDGATPATTPVVPSPAAAPVPTTSIMPTAPVDAPAAVVTDAATAPAPAAAEAAPASLAAAPAPAGTGL